jgi:hypothetical protein
MRRLLAAAVVATALAGTAGVATAKDIVTFPLCDLDGRCDRHCTVNTDNVLRCGYGA